MQRDEASMVQGDTPRVPEPAHRGRVGQAQCSGRSPPRQALGGAEGPRRDVVRSTRGRRGHRPRRPQPIRHPLRARRGLPCARVLAHLPRHRALPSLRGLGRPASGTHRRRGLQRATRASPSSGPSLDRAPDPPFCVLSNGATSLSGSIRVGLAHPDFLVVPALEGEALRLVRGPRERAGRELRRRRFEPRSSPGAVRRALARVPRHPSRPRLRLAHLGPGSPPGGRPGDGAAQRDGGRAGGARDALCARAHGRAAR